MKDKEAWHFHIICDTDATEDIRSLTIQQQVCSHGDGSEVERWSASRMISFLDRANISLNTITNLTLLYIIHSDVHHVSMNKEQSGQWKYIRLQYTEITTCDDFSMVIVSSFKNIFW